MNSTAPTWTRPVRAEAAAGAPGTWRRGSLTRRRLADEDLHPAVLGAAGVGGIVGERLVGAPAVDADAVGGDAPLLQVIAGGRGAVDRQGVVDGVRTGAVGVADDPYRGHRVLVQGGGQAVEHRAHVRLDVVAAGVEGDVAGDVELQLVVGGLGDAHAGAGGGLLHGGLLLLHVLGPQIAAARAEGRADGRARGRALALVAAGGQRADGRARHCADGRAGAGVALGLAHGGATGGAAGGEGEVGQADEGFFHLQSFGYCGGAIIDRKST